MNRSETIASIAENLSKLDDASLADFAELVRATTVRATVSLQLTPEQREAIERSREDFRAGRTLTLDEYRNEMSAFMAELETRVSSPS